MGKAVYKRERPELVIERTGGSKLGNCYYAQYYTVTSTRQLSKEKITGLYNLGLLGYGQEFEIPSQCDGDEDPAGIDVIPCIDDETGEVAINPYSEKEYEPANDPYFVYETVHRVDSSG